MNDVIIQTAIRTGIEDHSEDEHKRLSFVWEKTHSVDTVRGVLDRPL